MPHFLQITSPNVEQLADADSTARARIVETLDELTHMPAEEALSTIANSLVHVGMKILLAVVIFIVGRWLIKRVKLFMSKIFEKREVDLSLRTFLMSLVNITLTIFLIMTIIGILGLDTTSFIAIFASAGLALGVALSGTLQNFAGGVMLLLIKPYRVGDYISTQDHEGTVKSIMLFHTVLNTPDNQTVLVPNGAISTGVINNTSTEPTRRLEWKVDINYGDDFDRAKIVITDLLEKEPRILHERGYTVAINSLSDGSLEVVVQAWVKSGDYWGVFYDLNRQIYLALPRNGIQFPYQQIDINLSNKGNPLKIETGGIIPDNVDRNLGDERS